MSFAAILIGALKVKSDDFINLQIADIVSSFGGNLAVSPPTSVEKEEKRTESVENSSVSLSTTGTSLPRCRVCMHGLLLLKGLTVQN